MDRVLSFLFHVPVSVPHALRPSVGDEDLHVPAVGGVVRHLRREVLPEAHALRVHPDLVWRGFVKAKTKRRGFMVLRGVLQLFSGFERSLLPWFIGDGIGGQKTSGHKTIKYHLSASGATNKHNTHQ